MLHFANDVLCNAGTTSPSAIAAFAKRRGFALGV
jgi:hypothetical protein